MSIQKLRAAVRKAGGALEPDGMGGYEMIAPRGFRWTAIEVWYQPVPLGECESREEKRELLSDAVRWAEQGIEVSDE